MRSKYVGSIPQNTRTRIEKRKEINKEIFYLERISNLDHTRSNARRPDSKQIKCQPTVIKTDPLIEFLCLQIVQIKKEEIALQTGNRPFLTYRPIQINCKSNTRLSITPFIPRSQTKENPRAL